MSEDPIINLPYLPFARMISVADKGVKELEEELNKCAREGFRISQIISDNATMKELVETRSRRDRCIEFPLIPRPVFEPVIWMHVSEENVEYACVWNHRDEHYALQLKEQEGFRVIGQVRVRLFSSAWRTREKTHAESERSRLEPPRVGRR